MQSQENQNEQVNSKATTPQVVEAVNLEEVKNESSAVEVPQTRVELAAEKIKKVAGDLVEVGLYEGGRAI